MNIINFIQNIERIVSTKKDYQLKEKRVVIEVFNPGSIGGTPTVDVELMSDGFDWDSSKLILRPAKVLSALTVEQQNEISKSAKELQSWHSYQAHKVLNERIKALEVELVNEKAKVASLERGEYICMKCMLRKNSTHPVTHEF